VEEEEEDEEKCYLNTNVFLFMSHPSSSSSSNVLLSDIPLYKEPGVPLWIAIGSMVRLDPACHSIYCISTTHSASPNNIDI